MSQRRDPATKVSHVGGHRKRGESILCEAHRFGPNGDRTPMPRVHRLFADSARSPTLLARSDEVVTSCPYLQLDRQATHAGPAARTVHLAQSWCAARRSSPSRAESPARRSWGHPAVRRASTRACRPRWRREPRHVRAEHGYLLRGASLDARARHAGRRYRWPSSSARAPSRWGNVVRRRGETF